MASSKPLQQETPIYRSGPPRTPYQRAQAEWDLRIGDARLQARNWRFVAMLALIVAFVLLILLIVSLSLSRTRVYVAQVAQGGRVVNVAPLVERYTPTQVEVEYFIAQFIEHLRSVPLDPVVAKKNWLDAYHFLSGRGAEQLNRMFQQDNPLALLGKKTVTVKIVDWNAVSDQTYHIDWEEMTIGDSGQIEQTRYYSGMFTIEFKPPKTQKAILQNPLGIYIVDFHISTREVKT